MVVPVKFPVPGEAATASYDWTELASGEGYVTFDGYDTDDQSAGTEYNLSSQGIYTNSQMVAGTDYTIGTDTITFYSTAFNSPRVIKGTINFNLSGIWECYRSTASSSVTGYLKARLYKYDGSTSTLIGAEVSTASKVVSKSSGVIGWVFEDYVLKTTTEEVLIKKGEQLKLEVDIVVTAVSGAGTARIWLCHDPEDREITRPGTGTAGDTTKHTFLKINVPFRIDL